MSFIHAGMHTADELAVDALALEAGGVAPAELGEAVELAMVLTRTQVEGARSEIELAELEREPGTTQCCGLGVTSG